MATKITCRREYTQECLQRQVWKDILIVLEEYKREDLSSLCVHFPVGLSLFPELVYESGTVSIPFET